MIRTYQSVEFVNGFIYTRQKFHSENKKPGMVRKLLGMKLNAQKLGFENDDFAMNRYTLIRIYGPVWWNQKIVQGNAINGVNENIKRKFRRNGGRIEYYYDSLNTLKYISLISL